jgi:hypothetical protein
MFKEIPFNKSYLTRRRPIHGIGINDSEYLTGYVENGKKIMCPYYARWHDMLTRCYSSKLKARNPTYIGCSVCPEWLLFSNFRAWMKNQDWQDKQLDKDVILPSNKIYSPETCAFITRQLNTLLNNCGTLKGKGFRGATWNEERKKYQSGIRVDGKRVSLGRYDSKEEASQAYINAKLEMILDAVKIQSDVRVANGLRLHAEILISGSINKITK